MEHSPSWEADSCSVGQEIPCLLWYPKVHYCVHQISHFAVLIFFILKFFGNEDVGNDRIWPMKSIILNMTSNIMVSPLNSSILLEGKTG
jgi:hypothetical protein